MGDKTNRRKIIVITLGVSLLILFTVLSYLQAGRLEFLNPATPGQIFLYTSLSILAFILFVAVLTLLVRNVLKLYADQRSRVMGTRLRVRMLWGSVLVSLIPIVFMSLFSYLLMNRAVERWFSQPVTLMRDESNRMALDLSRYSTANARAEADSIASSLPTESVPATITGHDTASALRKDAAVTAKNREAINNVLRQHEITLQNGFAMVFRNGNRVAAYHMPQQTGATA